MAQLFRPGANTIARIVLLALLAAPLGAIALLMVLARSTYVTGKDRTVHKPVAFSHRHHTAEIGIDCRYCHASVETSARAGMPPTRTCMTCHSRLYTQADMLAPVRRSLAEDRPLAWNAVNALPDYVYFDHSIHVARQVACTTCHGEVGRMQLIRQFAPLTMQWCLDCHRDPAPRLSRAEDVFSPFGSQARWVPANTPAPRKSGAPPVHAIGSNLTDCSICHR
ncbi:MAG: cytochrome c3 family protein [Lautropia sp.]